MDDQLNTQLSDETDKARVGRPWAAHSMPEINKICLMLTEGKNLKDVAEAFKLPYYVVRKYVLTIPEHKKLYEEAITHKREWTIDTILAEFRKVGTIQASQILDENGNVKDPKEWPPDLDSAVKKMVVVETVDREGNFTGYVKTIEFHDKMKALDMLGKQLKLWNDDKAGQALQSLADLLLMSHEVKKVPSTFETISDTELTDGV